MHSTQTTCCAWHTFIWRINKRPKTSVRTCCCRDLWRSAWLKRVVLGAPTLDIIPAQEETIEQREEKAELMRAIHKLPVQFRETILLHYYQGLGISEIAQMLGLPEGTISSRLSRARKKLESLLKEEATGDGYQRT